MLTDIDDLLQADFFGDMEIKEWLKKDFTQKEAKIMSDTLGKIYSIAHCIHCEACGREYMKLK